MAIGNVKSTRRVFEFLEYFAQVQRELSVAEIAHHFHYPPSSVSAIMRTIVQLGYFSYNPGTRTYAPTPRLCFLIDWIGTTVFNEGRIRHIMQDLSDASGETIILGAQSGLRVQYLQVIEATGPVRLHAAAGDFRSLFHSAIGLMLLSQRSNAWIGRLARRMNANESDPSRLTNLSALLSRIQEIRDQEYALSLGGITSPGGALAMLLPEKVNGEPLAIAIGAPEANLLRHQDRWTGEMRKAIAHHY